MAGTGDPNPILLFFRAHQQPSVSGRKSDPKARGVPDMAREMGGQQGKIKFGNSPSQPCLPVRVRGEIADVTCHLPDQIMSQRIRRISGPVFLIFPHDPPMDGREKRSGFRILFEGMVFPLREPGRRGGRWGKYRAGLPDRPVFGGPPVPDVKTGSCPFHHRRRNPICEQEQYRIRVILCDI